MENFVVNSEEKTKLTVSDYADKYNDLLNNEDVIKGEMITFKSQYPEIFEKLRDYEDRLKDIDAKKEEIRQEVTSAMEEANLPDYSSGRVKITYVRAVDKESFDTKSFKAKYPDIAKDFINITHTSAYSKISLLKNK